MQLSVDSFKRASKRLSSSTAFPLNKSQELLAEAFGFSNFDAALKGLVSTKDAGPILAVNPQPEPAGPEPSPASEPQAWKGVIDLPFMAHLLGREGYGGSDRRTEMLMKSAPAIMLVTEGETRDAFDHPSWAEADLEAKARMFAAHFLYSMHAENLVATYCRLRDTTVMCKSQGALINVVFDHHGLAASDMLRLKYVDAFESSNTLESFGSRFPSRRVYSTRLNNKLIRTQTACDYDGDVVILGGAVYPMVMNALRTFLATESSLGA